MALRAQVLLHRQGLVEALRLEHYTHVPPHCRCIPHHIMPGDNRMALGGRHHGGKNTEERRFTAPVRPQQAKDLAFLDV